VVLNGINKHFAGSLCLFHRSRASTLFARTRAFKTFCAVSASFVEPETLLFRIARSFLTSQWKAAGAAQLPPSVMLHLWESASTATLFSTMVLLWRTGKERQKRWWIWN